MRPKTMLWISLVVAMTMVLPLFMKRLDYPYAPLNKMQAEMDIRSGQVRLLHFGYAAPGQEEYSVSIKYGFIPLHAGCIVGYTRDEQEYLAIVKRYLETRNGKEWEKKYENELDSLRWRNERTLNGDTGE